jgi:hypothetical protein
MSPADHDVIQLLLEMEILSKDDVQGIQAAQSDVLLKVLMQKRVVRPVDADATRKALEQFITTTNQTRKTQAQTELYNLIASGLDHRIDQAYGELREEKKRITERACPAVAMAVEGEG